MLFPYSHRHCFAFTSVVFHGAIFQIHIPDFQNPYPCPQFRFAFRICRLRWGGRRGLLDGGSSSSSLVTAARLSLGYHQPDSDHLNLHQIFLATLHFVGRLCCWSKCKTVGLAAADEEGVAGWVVGGASKRTLLRLHNDLATSISSLPPSNVHNKLSLIQQQFQINQCLARFGRCASAHG